MKSEQNTERDETPDTSANPYNELYTKSILTKTIAVPMYKVNNTIKELLNSELKRDIEGRCVDEGFVKPGSVHITSFSAGTIQHEKIEFAIVYEVDVCFPLEKKRLNCVVKTITKAGIHGHVYDKDSDIYPITVFIARDHHFLHPRFNDVKIGDTIQSEIIGVRCELNDKCVYVIATLIMN